jgi:hypothetical protein
VAPRRALTVGERMKRGWDTLLELLSSTGGAHPSFKGAEVSRIRPGQFGLIRGADREIEWDLRLLRGRARALRRNNPYIENYLNLQRTNVLGPSNRRRYETPAASSRKRSTTASRPRGARGPRAQSRWTGR